MRGMLVHYLIERDFSHEEASSVANAMRDSLAKEKEIPRKEFLKILTKQIRKDYGERSVGDLVFWEPPPASLTVETEDGSRPFSHEVLSHSIQASGLPPDSSYQIARAISSRLTDERRIQITHRVLEDLAADMLAAEHGKAYSERYRLWRSWGESGKPLIVLIGGASGVGKTSLAINLASMLDIPRVVATDDIRQIMRLMLARELMPCLHTSSYATEPPDSEVAVLDPVVTGFREQSQTICVGVRAIMSRCIEESTSVILDGVHLLPDFLDIGKFAKDAFVVQICLALLDRDVYEARFAKRATEAPARPADRYLAHIKEILQVQDHIVERNIAYENPVIEVGIIEDVTSAAVLMVGERLQEQQEAQKSGTNGHKKKKRA